MTIIKEDLIKAREKIEAGWCQGVAARDAKGRRVPFAALGAARFCILGAVYSSTEAPTYSVKLLHKALSSQGVEDVTLSAYNDDKGRTKKEVLSLFDDAIKLAEEEEEEEEEEE